LANNLFLPYQTTKGKRRKSENREIIAEKKREERREARRIRQEKRILEKNLREKEISPEIVENAKAVENSPNIGIDERGKEEIPIPPKAPEIPEIPENSIVPQKLQESENILPSNAETPKISTNSKIFDSDKSVITENNHKIEEQNKTNVATPKIAIEDNPSPNLDFKKTDIHENSSAEDSENSESDSDSDFEDDDKDRNDDRKKIKLQNRSFWIG